MIRNAVIHLLSEQPVIADLLEMPSPGDATLRCTNLRTKDGKRPVFIDQMDSTFIFPYLHIRFVEIHPDPATEAAARAAGNAEAGAAAAEEGDLEIDEEFLRRIREA
ncbi:MAG TPA: hypothetical protein VLS28_05215 [Candidatus Sulfomarinibacteraceae bacterium]|nr:hypothetical protein [Candidatus Sulfomarinibacteraceae bacterium]